MDEQLPSNIGAKRERPKKGPSNVLLFFTKYGDDSRCKCNYCGKDYACSSKSCGTKSLWNHIEGQCTKYRCAIAAEDKRQKVLTMGTPNNNLDSGDEIKNVKSNLVAVEFDKEACRKACTRMIIVDALPFSFVKKDVFKDFCRVACPRFIPPSRRTLARDIYGFYVDEKLKLKKYFIEKSPRVCLTTDTWTSIQNINYMVITSHFIDCEWKLHKRILSFGMIPDHKEEIIGKIIESCLLDLGIEKVFTITVDNASANKVAVDYVKRKMRNWNESKLVLGIESQSIVVLDVPNIWNSTYLMLSTALKFQKPFDRLLEDDGRYGLYFSEIDAGKKRVGPPKEDDWSNAKVFVQFLHVFYDITLKFSAYLSVTYNIFFHELCSIATELTTLASSGDFLLCEMAVAMKSKFDKYWGKIKDVNRLLIIALVLDPRYKLDYVKFCFGDLFDDSKVTEMTYDIKEFLIKLYEFYKGVDNISSSDQVSSSVPLANEGDVGKSSENSDFRLEILKKFKKMKEKKDFVDLRNEVERYLIESDENLDDGNFDLLNW
ncbi:hypothetical protein Ddye_021141 [Dipteronia dyeriana]|uniref:hAT-like transposase RNase-H fold domain-containing protein n=1 Tax=Dipteronia dyeriana TaxID=168575 RepID=A0AAD9WWM5_9ROSI|nr:hypothetical protein Ddye_021141 [Dipteronia dyeriana]